MINPNDIEYVMLKLDEQSNLLTQLGQKIESTKTAEQEYKTAEEELVKAF